MFWADQSERLPSNERDNLRSERVKKSAFQHTVGIPKSKNSQDGILDAIETCLSRTLECGHQFVEARSGMQIVLVETVGRLKLMLTIEVFEMVRTNCSNMSSYIFRCTTVSDFSLNPMRQLHRARHGTTYRQSFVARSNELSILRPSSSSSATRRSGKRAGMIRRGELPGTTEYFEKSFTPS